MSSSLSVSLSVSQGPGDGPGFFGSVVLGIVEGLTEFLPVSSTGHLIVTNRFLGGDDPAYEVAIQAGAITAIAFLYRVRLARALRGLFARDGGSAGPAGHAGARGGTNLLVLLLVAAAPAAVVGLLFENAIAAVLFNPVTVAAALVAGGVLLLVLEGWLDRRRAAGRGAPEPSEIDAMRVPTALWIGVFQILALVPGASRSAATIAGGLVCGLSRTAAAEFSFLVGLPILYGACAIKLAQNWERFTGPQLGDFIVGSVASFVTAALIVGPFVRFLRNHSFRAFAWYRIAAGAALFGLLAGGVLQVA